MDRFKFNPYSVQHSKEWWRFLTHGLLHADWEHLIMNMIVLYMFGGVVEQYFGDYFGHTAMWYYLILYIGGILVAVIPTFEKHKNDLWYDCVGASGAVSSVLFASVLFQPLSDLCLYGVLCLPGIVWAVVYLGYSYYMDKKGGDNVNHNAHFIGAVFGIVFTLILKPGIGLVFIQKISSYFH